MVRCDCIMVQTEMKKRLHGTTVRIGLYCKSCGTWIQWIAKKKIKREAIHSIPVQVDLI